MLAREGMRREYPSELPSQRAGSPDWWRHGSVAPRTYLRYAMGRHPPRATGAATKISRRFACPSNSRTSGSPSVTSRRRSPSSPTSGNDTVDIDHVVALSNAWQTGAFGWDIGKRAAFANDPLNLLAVDS